MPPPAPDAAAISSWLAELRTRASRDAAIAWMPSPEGLGVAPVDLAQLVALIENKPRGVKPDEIEATVAAIETHLFRASAALVGRAASFLLLVLLLVPILGLTTGFDFPARAPQLAVVAPMLAIAGATYTLVSTVQLVTDELGGRHVAPGGGLAERGMALGREWGRLVGSMNRARRAMGAAVLAIGGAIGWIVVA